MDDARDPARELLELELERTRTDAERNLGRSGEQVVDGDAAARIAEEAGMVSQLRSSDVHGGSGS